MLETMEDKPEIENQTKTNNAIYIYNLNNKHWFKRRIIATDMKKQHSRAVHIQNSL